jgi:hypothetical protein
VTGRVGLKLALQGSVEAHGGMISLHSMPDE